MIEPIYFLMLLIYTLLIVAFVFKSYLIGTLCSMGLIICGVFFLSGLSFLTNFLTMTLGIINVSIGSFIFIQGSLEQITQY